MLVFLPNALLCIYTFTGLLYFAFFIKQSIWLRKIVGVALPILIVTHVSVFILNFISLGHIPLSNIFEAVSSIALAISLIYFLIEILSKIKTTGFIFINISFILQLTSHIFLEKLSKQQLLFKNPFFMWHTGLAITSYAAFVIGSVYGILYLFLFRNIKKRKFGRFFKRMPSLEELNEMNLKSSVIGLPLLSFAVCLGYLWKQDLYGQSFHFDPKILISLLCCLLYLFQIIASSKLQWSGKRRSYLSIFGLVLILLSMIVGNLTTSYHKFF